MAGRTLPKFTRVYIDGYDMSGYTRSIGPLDWAFEEVDLTAQMGDDVKGYLPGHPTISPGTLNVVFETDSDSTTAAHHVLSSQNDDRVVLIAYGIQAAPVQGDPAFMGEFLQLGYQAEVDAGAVVANVPFGPWEGSSLTAYGQPWGMLAHALAASDSDGSDSDDYQDGGDSTATAFGGYMVWQVTAGNGTATITMEHCATETDSDAVAIGGLTTGEINCDSTVQTGVAVTTLKTTSINQYTRWQISMNTATTVTFALGFVRGRY